MNSQLESILELPVGHRLAILFGSLFIIFVLFWFTMFAPINTRYDDLSKKVEDLITKKNQQEGIVKNLRHYTDRVNNLNTELEKALLQLPDKREIDQLLLSISDKARDAGLEIKLFKPRGEEKRDFYAAVPVDIEVTGTYHQVASFFDEVGRMDRIVNLENVAISDPVIEKSSAGLKTLVTATAFRFLDESERPKADESGEKEGAKKRRRH
ncbi:MAG: type 4a pilus biogenesis protein PilO [Deltaproteobacteria bacterium]|nr:type 4a pilus biogenesis protein PilO [Deltaproteobacteria bacterium]